MWNSLITDDSDPPRRCSVAGRGGLVDLSKPDRKALAAAEYPRWMNAAFAVGFGLLPVWISIFEATRRVDVSESVVVATLAMALVSVLSLLLGVGGMIIRDVLGRRARAFRGAWIRLGRCAHCGYNLGHVLQADDGLTTCPECSARWRLGSAGE